MRSDSEISLKDTWETVFGGAKHLVMVRPEGVVVASNVGSPFGEAGTTCSLQEFLDSKCNELVEQIFGRQVLEEVRAAARLAMGTKEYAEHVARVARPLAFLHAIPFDESLKVFADWSNHEDNGGRHYGAGGEFMSRSGTKISRCTRLFGRKAILVYGYADTLDRELPASPQLVAYLVSEAPPSERLVDIGIAPANGIAYNGFFYICSADSFVVLSEAGERVEREEDSQMFGRELRIMEVMRTGDRVCFKYYWFDRKHPDGFLLFSTSRRTFTARWEES